MLKAIIFDFDGVITESVHIKSEAFAELYEPYGNYVVQKVVKDHQENDLGLSRFELFRYYHKKYLNIELSKKKENELINKFSILVIKKVINAPYVTGVLDYIDNCFNKYKLFISTGTPSDEIKIILKKRKIDHYFLDILGSPDNKLMHVNKIIRKYNLKPEELLYFGDSISDLLSAKEKNITFILRKHKYNNHLVKNYRGKLINNFLSEIDISTK